MSATYVSGIVSRVMSGIVSGIVPSDDPQVVDRGAGQAGGRGIVNEGRLRGERGRSVEKGQGPEAAPGTDRR